MTVEAIIFDLDDTLINTTQIKPFRKKPWKECYKYIPTKTFAFFEEDITSIIKNKDLKLGIVTNSPRPYATKVLLQHNIVYEDLICFHDSEKRKPHPDPLLKCCANLKALPQNTISIGDTVNDIIATKKAGMISIGVTWGESKEPELKNAGSDIILNHPNELVEFINNL